MLFQTSPWRCFVCRYLYFLWKSERLTRTSSVCRSHVPKLQGTHAHLSIKPVLTSDWCWSSVLHPYRTVSWSARISTTMTVISHTAPSAAEDEKCSCVGTTTAAGQCVWVCSLSERDLWGVKAVSHWTRCEKARDESPTNGDELSHRAQNDWSPSANSRLHARWCQPTMHFSSDIT